MGLEGIEIVMEVEETFDLCFDDADVEKILTPRRLIEVIQAKVASVETSVCLHHRAFNLLRRYMVEQWDLPRNRIRPKAKLSELIPKARRKLFLSQLATTMAADSPPPGLVRPAWLTRLGAVLCLAVGLGFALCFGADLENGMVLLLFAAGGSGVVGLLVTKPFHHDFPRDLATVGSLARWIRRHKPDLANCSQKAWTREQIASRVREIVVAHLDCAAAYHEDARFIEDLGLN